MIFGFFERSTVASIRITKTTCSRYYVILTLMTHILVKSGFRVAVMKIKQCTKTNGNRNKEGWGPVYQVGEVV